MNARLLVDTHVLLWALSKDPRLTRQAMVTLTRADLVVVSAASLWEICIKQQLGKLEVPSRLSVEVLRDLGYHLLPISGEHALRIRHLPLHHRDPFDRMLVAQAQCDRLDLVTHDEKLAAYDVGLVRV